MPNYSVEVLQSGRPIADPIELSGPVLVGRRDKSVDEPPPVEISEVSSEPKLVIADHLDSDVPRRWFRLSCPEFGTLLIENLHGSYELEVPGQAAIPAGSSREVRGPARLDLGIDRSLNVEPQRLEHPRAASDETSDQVQPPDDVLRLNSVPTIPNAAWNTENLKSLAELPQSSGQVAVELMRTALQVVQQAAGSDGFFESAADAVQRIVNLDRAIVLVRSDPTRDRSVAPKRELPDDWDVASECFAGSMTNVDCPPISTSILGMMDQQEKRTVIHRGPMRASSHEGDPSDGSLRRGGEDLAAPSLEGVHCVVASPVLNVDGEVIGAVYGDRWTLRGASERIEINELEATFVEVLAGAVAGGIARQDEERRRGTLSAFFSPQIANLLTANPDLIRGKDTEISVLFCDVRGFSTVTERLGPVKTIEWINDVLSELSQCVVDTDGVLVDYVGDELMAMWGAPGQQIDHASRAVDAAVAMLKSIEVLRERWADVLPNRFGAGIGVNTGPARVGNVGSRFKFKYGVLGNTVNIASRLQAASKQLGVHCIISEQTARQAKVTDHARRLATLSVVGIEQTLDVYQVVAHEDDGWQDLRQGYEQALADFDQQRFGEATQRLGNLIQAFPDDRPCRQLLARAADGLNRSPEMFSAVWKLDRK